MRPFALRWIAACAAAELVGIGFGALVGNVATPIVLGPPSVVAKLTLFVLTVAIGVVEGSALGLLQGSQLRGMLPRLRAREWAIPTVLFAAVGWALGMFGPILGQGEAATASADAGAEPPLAVVLLLAALVGGAAGALIGLAQWLVLRRHAENATTWIPANALGWTLAMPAIFAGFAVPADDASPLVRLACGALGGLAGGALLGVATLPFARRLQPWVADSAVLAGKTAVVTGATAGIGFEVAVGLARLGARTVLVGRSPEKLAASVDAVRRAVTGATVDSVVCDLSDEGSIDRAAVELGARVAAIDVLVHDAAATFAARTVTRDGLEATLAVDVLGPARLTQALDERIAPGAHVVVLTGIYQRRGVIDAKDLHFAHRPYSMAAANAQAQRMRLAFVAELARRRPDLFVAAVHPGAVRTSALAHAPAWARLLAATVAAPAFVRAELGALPALRLATAVDVPSGRFWNRFTLAPDVPRKDEVETFATATAPRGLSEAA